MKRIFCFLIIFCFFVCNFSYSQSPDDKIQEHYRLGKEYSAQGEYLKANEEFKLAEELLKDLKPLSKDKNVSKKSVSKTKVLSKKQEKLSRELNTMLKKAYELAKSGNSQLAMTLYLKALRLAPNNADIHHNLASFYLQKRDYWEAVQELQYVVKINREDADAHYNLGILYEIYLNDSSGAVRYYEKYLALKPLASDKLLVLSWIESLKKNKK